MDIKDAKIKVLTALVKYYRSQLKEKSIAMDEKRVRKILR